MGCRACATAGGGCQFLGTAATSQVVGEALGLSLTHSALAPSGQPIWLDIATRSARALEHLEKSGITSRQILTDASIRNAMACMRHSAARRICSCTFRPSPTRPDSLVRQFTTGSRSTGAFPGSSMRCRMGRWGIRRFAFSGGGCAGSHAASPRARFARPQLPHCVG